MFAVSIPGVARVASQQYSVPESMRQHDCQSSTGKGTGAKRDNKQCYYTPDYCSLSRFLLVSRSDNFFRTISETREGNTRDSSAMKRSPIS